MAERLAIAQVSPYPWERPHEVTDLVRGVSDELAGRGHRVIVVAPSSSPTLVRDGRRAVRGLSVGELPQDGGEPLLLAVGEAVEPPLPGRRRHAAALPIAVTRTLGELFAKAPLDIVHVHEPFAPSIASAALRASRALNVGSFHVPQERLVATQVARRMVQLVFGRLDVRTATYQTTAELMGRHFPAAYRLLAPGAPALERVARGPDVPLRIAFLDEEERPALRLLLRALRHLETDRPWELVVRSARGPSSTPLRASLRERVSYVSPDALGADELLAGADLLVAASAGAEPQPGLLARACAAGAVPLATALPVYEDVLGEGERGLLFQPRDADSLAGQLARLIDDDALRRRLAAAARPRPWSVVADELELMYEEVAARRKDRGTGDGTRRRLAGRRMIDVDLHMHTDHSHDCATPVEVLLATARERGLGAVAITDHNEISGALEAAEKAAEYGVKVIVGEEVKTASQGEVIGLFLSELIPRGLTLEETLAEIRRQGGLVYVPHPFDRMHSVPDYEHLLRVIEQIDAIEVFNPRVAFSAFNEEAARFAAKYRIAAGAGSDAHVAQGLGTARVRMRDFDGPEEFLASLRDGEIRSTPTSYAYVQVLKFLQTKATPPGARRTVRERRVRRVSRKG
ncbi:MAG: CehA/McbA family metallohydrolase [Solirubrobacteraceae bacterium]|nr:CehA/McbA family metallohydrolase [Solirubrobacteraceae bacterium]